MDSILWILNNLNITSILTFLEMKHKKLICARVQHFIYTSYYSCVIIKLCTDPKWTWLLYESLFCVNASLSSSLANFIHMVLLHCNLQHILGIFLSKTSVFCELNIYLFNTFTICQVRLNLEPKLKPFQALSACVKLWNALKKKCSDEFLCAGWGSGC